MNYVQKLLLACVFFTALASPLLFAKVFSADAPIVSFAAREDAYRANNLGVALLEQYKYKEGVEEFRRALSIDPKLAAARINLVIALFNVPDPGAAQREALAAKVIAPGAPQPDYILGLIAKSQNRTDDAIKAFQNVVKFDPQDVGANVQLGQLYGQQRKYTEAVAALRTAVAAEPYNLTAVYNLAQSLLRSGNRDEGQKLLKRFQELRASGAGTSIGQNYLEQGRYATAVTSVGSEPELVDTATPDIKFTDASASTLPDAARQSMQAPKLPGIAGAEIAAKFAGGVTLFDFDGDDQSDLLEVTPNALHLYRNDGGKFIDVTAQSGLAGSDANAVNIAAVAGDYDNDGKPDIFVLRYSADKQPIGALYHNDGGGKFSEKTAQAKIPNFPYLARAVAFVDVDHDGDLDIVVAGYADLKNTKNQELATAPNLLLRNNGDSTFTDISAEAKINEPRGHSVAVVPTDYDNRNDVDLLFVHEDSAPTLLRNLRDHTFLNVTRETGLDKINGAMCVAVGDVNKDGYTDFFFGQKSEAGVFALSDNRTNFNVTPAPQAETGATAAQFFDYDNDGLLDLVTMSPEGLRVWRNLGKTWANVTKEANGEKFASQNAAHPFVSADADGDGDIDIIALDADNALRFLRNEGGNRNRSLRVQLNGRVSNKSGVQAKIEARAGSLWQKLETYAASPAPAPSEVVFGIGKRESIDAVRIIWASGVVQSETAIPNAQTARNNANNAGGKNASPKSATLNVVELDRKPSSCPFLYTWNGERFEFITDFMGGGEMGDWIAPGKFNTPDPDEYVRIRADQLKPLNNRYELRVTNELEEALYVDKLQLVAIAHPQGTNVFPDEGLGKETNGELRLYTTKNARPPAAAIDERGQDVSASLSKLDNKFVDDFALKPLRGYAGPHSLTLDLGAEAKRAKRLRLFFTGWTDYAFSSDNVAASQSNLTLQPPAIQVKNRRGDWQTVVPEFSFPVGRPQTNIVDLTGKFLTTDRHVRITTNMRVYWDQILIDTSISDAPSRVQRINPTAATLRSRGYSAEIMSEGGFGREPLSYDYTKVSYAMDWKAFPGRYTREGDVRELLTRIDDMFVVSRHGDEIALSFDATALAPLPAGWTRTFLLYADGFSKEMNPNSASPHELAPLPFQGMSRYPYSAPEGYPDDAAHRAYQEKYNTRIVAAPLPTLTAKTLLIAR